MLKSEVAFLLFKIFLKIYILLLFIKAQMLS